MNDSEKSQLFTTVSHYSPHQQQWVVFELSLTLQIPLPLLLTIRNVDVFPCPTMKALPISGGRSICFRWFQSKTENSHAQENHAIYECTGLHSFDLFIIHYSHKTLVNPQRYLICCPICLQLESDHLKKLHWIRNKISI